MSKPKLKTVQSFKKWRAVERGVYAGAFASPVIPATVVTAINWEEWFAKSSTSLPFGFAMLIVAVISAIIGVFNSDTIFKKTDIALICLSGWFIVVGLALLFLSALIRDMGLMWIYVGCGLLGSAGSVFADKKWIKPNVELYQGLIQENCLDRKSKRNAKRAEQARKDAEEDALRQATE